MEPRIWIDKKRKPGTDIAPAPKRVSTQTYAARRAYEQAMQPRVQLPTFKRTSF